MTYDLPSTVVPLHPQVGVTLLARRAHRYPPPLARCAALLGITLGAGRDTADLTAAERVARGAALLDEHMPGWAARINLAALQLASPELCVLGQLFDEPRMVPNWKRWGFISLDEALENQYPRLDADRYRASAERLTCTANYTLGLVVLGIHAEDDDGGTAEVTYGFAAGEDEWVDLDRLWAEQVRQRQAAS